ncbi:MAG: phosphoadenosine phosphosulfate reductase [Candidatus Hydrogenedentota bacterium]|nr:MAG: phosphoadenosine phosphosulfate reductase [Candidatus Hydrogenedentota bacterium]
MIKSELNISLDASYRDLAKRTDVRHILGLSGGKDSAALAIYLRDKVPNMEYFFCDTGKELKETYEYLEKLEARLGIEIIRLKAERGFDHFLKMYNGFLPSPQARWCTIMMKIKPLEKFIGDDPAISYVGIRADENRSGYMSTKDSIRAVFPFQEDGLVKEDIFRILEESGLGIPKYYEWRSRSGCFFCFYQRKYEWVMLHEKHPDLFYEAMKYEEEHSDGRKYTWNRDESLREILVRKEEIIAAHRKKVEKEVARKSNKSLVEVMESVLDEEDDTIPCFTCHL